MAALALLPALAVSAPAAGQGRLELFTGNFGDGRRTEISAEPARDEEAPAGTRSLRLTALKAGVVIELYVTPGMHKRIDPLNPGTTPGAGAWTRITTLRPVPDYVVGSFDMTYADRFVRVEYNGPGRVDGEVTRIRLYDPTAVPAPVRFAQISDLHVNQTAVAPFTCSNCPGNRALIAALNALDSLPDPSGKAGPPVSFVLVTGDVADRPFPVQADTFAAMYEALRMPYHLVSGNHDTHASNIYRDETAALNERQHGGLYLYSFNFGGIHFVAQHTNCADLCREKPNWNAFNASLDFLEEDLRHVAPGVPVVVFQHFGFDRSSVGWWPEEYKSRFLALLAGRNLAGLLTGHDHGLQSAEVPGHGPNADILTGSADDARGPADRRIRVYRFAGDTLTGDVLDWTRMKWQADAAVVRPLAPDTFWSAPGRLPGEVDDVPAFATVGGRRYMLWSDRSSRRIRLASYSDADGRWMEQGSVAPTSADAVSWGGVAAVAFKGSLTVVWHKDGTQKMYVSSLVNGAWAEPVQLPGMDVGNYKSPAAAVLRDTLHIVFNSGWIGDYRLWHTWSADGRSFSGAAAIGESYTDNQPALVARGGELSLMWTRHLGDRAIYHQSWSAGRWSGPFAVVGGTATSDRGPGLAWNGDRLFLAWSDRGRLWQAMWRDNVWSAKTLIPLPTASHRGVSLYMDGDRLYAGWNGDSHAWFASRTAR